MKFCIYKSKYPLIDVVKGDVRLREDDAAEPDCLKRALEQVEDRYDICLIDTRPAFEKITLNAIHAADVMLVPVYLDKFCRDNLLLVEDQISRINTHDREEEQDLPWFIFVNKIENKRVQKKIYQDMVSQHSWPVSEHLRDERGSCGKCIELVQAIVASPPEQPGDTRLYGTGKGNLGGVD